MAPETARFENKQTLNFDFHLDEQCYDDEEIEVEIMEQEELFNTKSDKENNIRHQFSFEYMQNAVNI
ncbi:unnamed protein product [Didymodactylos carnosus]|uniref:Uncharacterized protein n=1 Tax=Didymodactylos carnosus TaxID=1234261 RepID=A0A814SVK5_9BILA|nr:unnamed protein product [Didymodactylos carnosus]CAF1563160.1 unnamed protein product [Didymodactylos carnosus]CAF3916657.1 unnamed protein product [Didymodactylos carnosus]CAF4355555.1 unnamed protein product [Didymodactylos carnosus]